MPDIPEQVRCTACEQTLPRAAFAAAQLKPLKLGRGVQRCRECLSGQQLEEDQNRERKRRRRAAQERQSAAAAGGAAPSALIDESAEWSAAMLAEQPPAPPAMPSVRAEQSMATSVKRLRSELRRLCVAGGAAPPLLAFERWQARKMIDAGPESLIPTGVCVGLERDLVRAGLPAADAAAGAAKMSEKGLSEREKASAQSDDACEITERRTRTGTILQVEGCRTFYEVSREHYGKLWRLYTLHTPEADRSEADWRRRLWALLCRYSSLGGHGYQAACGHDAFETMRKRLGVTFECFASPLNARFPRFCSAFPDTDAAFGSVCSFWNFTPQEGSYEVNPPYVPEVMWSTARRIELLLKASQKPLSFVVVIPAWKQVPAWEQFGVSRWRRLRFVIPVSEHGFVDGKQHTCARDQLARPPSYDTAIIVLQNEAGAEKWPVAGMEAVLRDAFKKTRDATGDGIPEYERRVRGVAEDVGAEGQQRGEGEEEEPGPKRRCVVLV
eukprot:TRINITY_DN27140_c0_g1_i1.p1 TRINITY_DN27140_c0_g1~~TRINITY_DN27140_c0_g1_i1.p1  ORF type:complete len:519 (+),score=162.71 TRINITY_DN27140_c0_g1_i1:64-1557(+)